MAGVNPGPGGPGAPVGGIPMMHNGSSAPRIDATNNSNNNTNNTNNASSSGSNPNDPIVVQLNTYIYDYFIKRGYHDSARALVQDEAAILNTVPQPKGGRRDGEVNGVDADAMMTDSKDDAKKLPDDLPRPHLNGDQHDSSFLFDWWNLFWDIFSAQRKKGKSSDAIQYLQHTQNLQRAREQSNMVRHAMVPNNQFGMRGMRPGMVPPNLQKSVLQNNTQNMTPQQVAQFKNQQAQMMHQQMQREQSDMEMNGHRPQSPSSVDNAPSPSKRPRLDGSQPNGPQVTPNGRGPGQAMPNQPNNPQTNAMLMQHGLNPRQLTPQQFQALQAQNPAAQAKAIQGMPNGLMNPGVMPNQEMMPMPDGQELLQMQDYYGTNGQMRPGVQTPGGTQGNHALHDYQMQLMLLEQQNKKRLLLARQEQPRGAANGAEGQQGMPPQATLPPGTSPQDSRPGGSPNPNDQMKRATPKLPQNGIPESPNVGGAVAAQSRGSPASMNFTGQVPPDMAGTPFFNMKGMPDGVVPPNGMRPPSSNPAFSGPQVPQPMEAMARQQQGPGAPVNRVPSGGNWQQQPPQGQQQPMVPPQQQQAAGQSQQPPAATPQERNAMPPPQAPSASSAAAAASGAAGRTQTSSPQSGAAAPPTPQPANKPAPKSKKEGTEKARKRNPPKKNAAAAANASATAATPSSEAEPPQTPTTPITPGHPNAVNKNAASNAQQPTSAPGVQPAAQPQPPQQPQQPPHQAQAAQQPQQPQPQPQPPQHPPQQPPQQQQQQDPSQGFGDISLGENNFNLDFSALDNPDILENFDFDSFLNTDDPSGFTFDTSIAYPPDGVETGAGEGL